jgi:hypothetical protein
MTMDRIRLAALEVTNGSLPPATIDFARGLNVLSGKENRGKSYVFSCLDFIFGAEDPPEPNSHSAGYDRATLYFALGDDRRGVVRREFTNGKAESLPYHPVAGDVPSEGWQKLAKQHTSKSESLSKFWLTAMGFGSEILRKNASGAIKNLTIRIIAHLALIDELRILEKRSPLRSSQAVAWPGDDDAFALVLNARSNPPEAAEPEDAVGGMAPEVRSWIEAEIKKLDDEIADISSEQDGGEDEAALITRRADEFTTAADSAARELRKILEAINVEQQNLTEVKSHGIASREIVTRLELLKNYYQSDLRRLAAVNETAFLLGQLNEVACPTCFQPFDSSASEMSSRSNDYLQLIQQGTRAEAGKIVRIQADLDQAVAEARGEVQQATDVEVNITAAIMRLRQSVEFQERLVAEAHARMSRTFAEMGKLAHRKAIKERRRQLADHLGAIDGVVEAEGVADEPGEKTRFEGDALQEYCNIVAKLLAAWEWSYTPQPVEVKFDTHYKRMDIVISGEPKRSFGKAARAILNSAVLVGLMEYCFDKGLPHPGFVVLDSPLTTKPGKGSATDNEKLPDEMVVTVRPNHPMRAW